MEIQDAEIPRQKDWVTLKVILTYKVATRCKAHHVLFCDISLQVRSKIHQRKHSETQWTVFHKDYHFKMLALSRKTLNKSDSFNEYTSNIKSLCDSLSSIEVKIVEEKMVEICLRDLSQWFISLKIISSQGEHCQHS